MTNEDMRKILLMPDAARIVEGLRDTGYDFNTAMADIVDNSIAANATVVKVKIDMDPNGEVRAYIADNGCGMNFDGLCNAMRYGSARRDDPNSLGKFGLGLKTASTAFSRCLSLLSRDESSEYYKVRWDLDEIVKRNKWELVQLKVNEDEVELLEEVTHGGSGTLVIWEKVDRLIKAYSSNNARIKAFKRIIENLKQHFAMVYQRFLDDSFEGIQHIELYVNEDKILPWDPFCRCEPKTQILANVEPKVTLPDGSESYFKVTAYLLPRKEEYRVIEKNKARISNDYEGFYVYRENRLIHYGDWLGMFVNDPHISLLRVDFSFDHSLDTAFNVDIKKSKILPDDGIMDYLLHHFIPAPRKAAEDLYRKSQIDCIRNTGSSVHDASNANIEEKAKDVERAKVDVINPETNEVKVTNTNGTFTGTIKIISNADNNKTRVIPVGSLDDGLLWEPTIADGKHAVSINQGHPYYTKVYGPNMNNPDLITGMDALLWALSEAELGTYSNETKNQYEEMRYEVSRIIKRLVAELPDPDIAE